MRCTVEGMGQGAEEAGHLKARGRCIRGSESSKIPSSISSVQPQCCEDPGWFHQQ